MSVSMLIQNDQPDRDVELVAAVSEFAVGELAPLALALDSRDLETLNRCWDACRSIDLDQALVPAARGGPGLTPREFLSVIEELAYAEAGTALAVLLHNLAIAATGDARGRLGARDRWALVPVTSDSLGPCSRAFGPTRVQLTRSPADPGSDIRINSVLPVALGAADAAVIVFDAGEAGFAAVHADGPGVAMREMRGQMGLRASGGARIELFDAPAFGSQRRSDATGAVRVLLHHGIAAIARGVTRRAHQLAVEYAIERFQGGSSIIEHGAVRDALGRMATLAMAGSATCPEAVDSSLNGSIVATGDMHLARAIAANVAAGEAAITATTDAVQVFGGAGYMRETGVEKLMRDAAYCAMLPAPRWVLRDQIVALEQQLATGVKPRRQAPAA